MKRFECAGRNLAFLILVEDHVFDVRYENLLPIVRYSE